MTKTKEKIMNDITAGLVETAEDIEKRNNQFLPEDEWMDVNIDNYWLNPEDDWERAKNALFINDAPIGTLGGLSILTGQSGNGKTMTLAMMMAAIFRGEYGDFKLGDEIENATILYVDTEMEKYNTQRLMNRVYYLNGWEFKTQKPQFRILRLRDVVTVADRWKMVLKAIDEVKPTFCYLDGLLDLVRDFNDNVECQTLIYKLMAAASWYNMSVFGVIHQNPGGDKMAGHLGSFGERKAITVLSTKKDKNGKDVLFVVDQKKARDKDADNVTFRVNDDHLHIGIPVPLNANEQQVQQEDKEEELKAFFRELDFPANGKSWTELDNDIRNKGITSKRKREQMFADAQGYGFLEKANKRYYFHENANSSNQKDVFDQLAENGELDGL